MKKNLVSVMALGMALMSTSVTAFAAEGAELINPSKGDCRVELKVEANYTVKLPAQVNLEYASEGLVNVDPAFMADYDVTVKGLIPEKQGLEITCKDVTLTGDDSKTLDVVNGFDAARNNAGAKVVTVKAAEINDQAEGHAVAGHMETLAHGVNAGTYQGTADFADRLVNAQ